MSRKDRYRNKIFAPLPKTEEKVTKTGQDRWQQVIVFLFHLLVLLVPLIFTWFNEELFEFNKMILTYALTVSIGMVWLGRMIWQRRIILRRTVFDIPIVLFFVSQLLATIFSMNIHTSIFGYYTRFHGGLFSTISYITLFYAFVSNVEKKNIRPLFVTTFVSAFLISLMAIPEHFGHAFSCLLVNTNQNLIKGTNAFSLSNLAAAYNVKCWVQDVQTRVYATFGQPNWLAAYAITLIPVGVILSLPKKNSRTHFFFGLVSVLLVFSLLFTKSRSGFLGFGVGMVVLLVTKIFWIWQNKIHILQEKVFLVPHLLLVLFATAMLVYGTPYTPTFAEFWQQHVVKTPVPTLSPTASPAASPQPVNRLEIGGTDSADIRRIVWTGAIHVWLRYPIFGSGVETFAYSYYKDRPVEHNLVSEWDFLYNKAHNEFLNFLATTGAVGFLTYCGMLLMFIGMPLVLFWQRRQQFNQDPSEVLLLPAFSAGLISLSISNFFGFSTVMVAIFLFLYPALTVVMTEKTFRSYFPFAPSEETELSMQQLTTLILTFLIGAGLLFSIWSMWRADRVFARGKQEFQAGQITKSVDDLMLATEISPHEPVFQEQLALTYGQAAASLAASGQATDAAQIAELAVESANKMIALNPVNVNYYKSQARVFLYLAQLNPDFIIQAKQALDKAHQLAPTDAKVMYNIALLENDMGQSDASLRDLEATVVMKANYGAARISLAQAYEALGRINDAKAQYQYVLRNISPDDQTSLDGLRQLATMSAQIKKK